MFRPSLVYGLVILLSWGFTFTAGTATPTTATPTTATPTTATPTNAPSYSPSNSPSNAPSFSPTTATPTNAPSFSPTTATPTNAPSFSPTNMPSYSPTGAPSFSPTSVPTVRHFPSDKCTAEQSLTAVVSAGYCAQFTSLVFPYKPALKREHTQSGIETEMSGYVAGVQSNSVDISLQLSAKGKVICSPCHARYFMQPSSVMHFALEENQTLAPLCIATHCTECDI